MKKLWLTASWLVLACGWMAAAATAAAGFEVTIDVDARGRGTPVSLLVVTLR